MSEEKQSKYYRLRPQLIDGCLLLTTKNKFISKAIRSSDKNTDGTWAEFSHVGIVFEKLGRMFIIDSNGDGVHPELLSVRIDECADFIFIKPLAKSDVINAELVRAINRADKVIKYDYMNGLKELCNRRFDLNFKIKKRDSHDICSDFTSEFALNLNMVTDDFKDLRLAFPNDYVRYNNFRTTVFLK